jgi:hypothetical protein
MRIPNELRKRVKDRVSYGLYTLVKSKLGVSLGFPSYEDC